MKITIIIIQGSSGNLGWRRRTELNGTDELMNPSKWENDESKSRAAPETPTSLLEPTE